MELEQSIYEQIQTLSEDGNILYDRENYKDAIIKWKEALLILPEPKNNWEAATWLLGSIGDSYYLINDYVAAKDYLYDAMNCPGALDNAFLNLRLGEALFELGELEKSQQFLLRAYILEGEDLFHDEDPKFIHSISNIL